MRHIHRLAIWAIGLTAIAAAPAFADITFSISTNGTSGGNSVLGRADFDINTTAQTIAITLTNQSPTVNDISEVLDGFSVSLKGTGSISLTPSSLAVSFPNSQANGNFVDCTGDTTGIALNNCLQVTTFDNDGNQSIPSTYWGLTGPFTLVAGQGYHPAGIVNASIACTNNACNGGTANSEHNDFLLGPVTFTFNYTGSETFSGATATFDWGTTPATTNGSCTVDTCRGTLTSTVPEPTSIALLGGIVVFAARTIRRKYQRA